jgi:flagellar biosynthesis protein FliR
MNIKQLEKIAQHIRVFVYGSSFGIAVGLVTLGRPSR